MSFHVPEEYRITRAHLLAKRVAPDRVTVPFEGKYGAFYIPGPYGVPLFCIASDGADWKEAGLPGPAWEHVSVSTKTRCPNWPEMCRVKDSFWDPEDVVMQLHPPRSEYVNIATNCLHLWRPVGVEIQRPPAICVGQPASSTEAAPSW